MLLKRTLTTLVLALSLAAATSAQQTPQSGLTVRSNPDGAEVTLKGDAIVTGITPTTFHQLLVGSYTVIVKRHGYENYKTHVMLDPNQPASLDVRLSPRTRIKAAARSLFVPGWGQYYGQQKTKGVLFTLLAAGSVGAFLIADHDFQNKNDLFKASEHAYDSSVAAGASYQELVRAQASLASTQKKAYDSENVRRATLGAVIGVWSLSLLDALLFFPEDHGTFTVKGISVTPDTKPGTLGLTLSRRF
jgi:hypothetical protein